jgi:uncharacterized HAD superfamily protein
MLHLCLTKWEIAIDAIMADAMEVWSDREQNPTIKKKCLSSAGDGTDAVINNVGSSTNQELQQYYIHFVREIATKEKQQKSVQTNIDSFCKPELLHSKISTTSVSSTDKQVNVMCLYLIFK